jgi:hypothetical protein
VGYAGAAKGTITSLTSYTLQAVSPATTMLDVYTSGGPAVAQITLNHFNNATGAMGAIVDVQATDGSGGTFFTNAVYSGAMTRVSFYVHAGFGAGSIGDTWCMALANIFEYDPGATIDATPPEPQPGSGGVGPL